VTDAEFDYIKGAFPYIIAGLSFARATNSQRLKPS
jgi:hypothetical protein